MKNSLFYLLAAALLLPLAASAQRRKAPARPTRAAAPSPARPVAAAGTFEVLAGKADIFATVHYKDGSASAARFSIMTSVAVNAAGTVYVADTDNHVIRKITAAGEVSTLAGLAGTAGSADGAGAAARFNKPMDLAVDAAGTLYVADTDNHTIRKVTAAGVVTTLAGAAGTAGSTDGPGATARFAYPAGIAVVSANLGGGTVYVADGRHTIRRITAAGEVSTLAGLASTKGSDDGVLTEARFNRPTGVAVDAAGIVYVADQGNNLIRRVSPIGEVTTLAGRGGAASSGDGLGTAAGFKSPGHLAVDAAGTLYVSDGIGDLRIVAPDGAVTTLPALTNRYPNGVAVGPKGRLYVTSMGTVLVRR